MSKIEVLNTTTSICPECMEPIKAQIVIDPSKGDKGWVLMLKTCEKHGDFSDKLSSNPELWKWKHSYVPESARLTSDPKNTSRCGVKRGCPYDCGLCTEHMSAANCFIIDVTNRCNLNCPICFANSNAAGRIVEYTYDEIVKIMKHFIGQKPYTPAICQFSGGEPTLHPRIIDILKVAKELGFPHRMLNTNGIRMARSLDFCQQIKDADCGAIYLSFDTFDPEVSKTIRGMDLIKIKNKVITNCREIGIDGIMLVVTVVGGENNHEVKAILDYAKANRDVVAGVIFQPVSLSGRISMEDLFSLRYTSSDLVEELNKATDGKLSQTYPLQTTSALTSLLTWYEDIPMWAMTAHEDCGWATLLPIDKDGNWVNLDDYIDARGVMEVASEIWDMVQKREIPKPSKLINGLHGLLDSFGLHNLIDTVSEFADNMSDWAYRQSMKAYFIARVSKYVKVKDPKQILTDKFIESTVKLLINPGLENSKGMLMNGNLMIGCMHFMDAYDLDIERTKRCVIHYGVLDPHDPDKVLEIPFCTFNTIHRERIEKEWAKTHSKKIEKTEEEYAVELEAFNKTLESHPSK